MLLDDSRVGTKKVKYAFLGDEQVYGEHFKYQLTAGNTITLTITADSTLMAGIDFPADIDISLCMCGGGGGGSSRENNDGVTGGGHRGAIVSQSVNLPYGESVVVTIGGGGAGTGGGHYNGGAGGQTTFGVHLTALGGAGGVTHAADYDSGTVPFISPCDGLTYMDGLDGSRPQGGQAGAFGNGGASAYESTGGSGGIGAGGGAVTGSYGGSEWTGPGGRGQIVLKWEKF